MGEIICKVFILDCDGTGSYLFAHQPS